MTYKEVNSMIASIGLPYAYYQFNKKTAQAPPFICFFYANSNDFAADNTNYQRIERLVVELYTDEKDFSIEKTIEDTLNAHELVFTREETPLDDERMYEVIFETDVIITEETTNE